ncbi:unnamed protein product, partial [Ectocarpus sp. 12 AP-2014]
AGVYTFWTTTEVVTGAVLHYVVDKINLLMNPRAAVAFGRHREG